MLENRSFDQMLGYLAMPEDPLPGVEGLAGDWMDAHPADTFSPLDEAIFAQLRLDPPHDAKSVTKQLAGGDMTGFAEAFADKLRKDKDTRELLRTQPELAGVVMQHLTREH